jgi:probable HAF family extracellular repeat protein
MNMTHRAWLIASALFSTVGTVHAAYQFSVLDGLGGIMVSAAAINNVGQIVGYSSLASSDVVQHATLWEGGKVTDLGAASGGNSWAYGINDAGQIVGASLPAGDTSQHATIWTNGTPTLLPTPAGSFSGAGSINNAGQIVGNYFTADNFDTTQPLIWNNGVVSTLPSVAGTFTTASAINNAGLVAGQVNHTDGGLPGEPYDMLGHAIVWRDGALSDQSSLGPDSETYVNSINDLGQMVGEAEPAGIKHVMHAVLWDANGVHDLGTTGAEFSDANDINNLGQIVGSLTFSGVNAPAHAALWDHGNLIDLNTLLDADAVAEGWELMSANGINDNGWIIGNARNLLTGAQAEFLLQPSAVPEVAALPSWLLGLGLMTLALRRRRA